LLSDFIGFTFSCFLPKGEKLMQFPIEKIETMIYTIRGHRVMLDSDLAKLYGVETGALNRQVKRNISRFPNDFMFQLTYEENEVLRCQFGISKAGKGGRRYQPFVLKSKKAIQVNIAIMRTFTKLRSFLAMENSNESRISDLETGIKNTHKLFKVVFERLNTVEENISPKLPANRKKIGRQSNLK
jgi:hypothetical protein